MVNIITLLTDFGLRDSYVGQLKGVLLSRATQPLQIVDISHEVPPQDIRAGGRLLREASVMYPPGTVHVAVVDPGVGTDRRIVAVELAGQRYVLPDNGLMSLLLDDFAVTAAHVVENTKLWRAEPSPTFHGRDIMAPVAVFLAEGGELTQVGSQAVGLQRLKATVAVRLEGGGWLLEVAGIDHFGNVLTALGGEQWADWGAVDWLSVELPGRALRLKVVRSYGAAAEGELVALIGSQGRLELAQVNGSAACTLGIGPGDQVKIRRE
jgi:S-adenosylmethionine hydrolase